MEALLKLTIWDDEPEMRTLQREAAEFVRIHLNRPLKEIELGQVMDQVFELAQKHRLRITPDLLLLIKALTTLEGLGRQLNPDFDVIAKASPFVRRVYLERYHPKRLAEDISDFSGDMLHLAKEVPGELRSVLRQARQGRFRIELSHGGLEPLRITLDRMSNRLSFSIVLASLIIGSSLIIISGIPPTWHSIPLIGLAGYLVAGVMGFWLLISILRRGRM